jgi:hypothetical protein
MSAPAPLIVNVPDAYVVLPPTAGLPMSVASHGEGGLVAVVTPTSKKASADLGLTSELVLYA